MKIIKASHQILSREGKTPYQFIEEIGRKCYKSEDKITKDSAVKFVQGLVKRQHLAMVEHYWVHLVYIGNIHELNEELNRGFSNLESLGYYYEHDYELLKYIERSYGKHHCYISAPLRVFFDLLAVSDMGYTLPRLLDEMCSCVAIEYPEIFEGNNLSFKRTPNFVILEEDSFILELKNDFKDEKLCEKEIRKHISHSVLFVCDRGVSHELVRHRPCSFAQESTRYCNYGSKNGEITVILPLFFDTGMGVNSNSLVYEEWKYSCEVAERKYLKLLEYGATPQEARSVLPTSLKTEIIVTANEKEWQHIVNLRVKGTTGKPHPQMAEVMTPVYEDLKKITGGRIK